MGEQAVARAMAYPTPAPITAELLDRTAAAARDGLAALEEWMRALDPATLAAVVIVITGDARAAMLGSGERRH